MKNILYLWDLGDTLFIQEWTEQSGCESIYEYIEKQGLDPDEITSREFEEMYEEPLKNRQLIKISVADGYKEVLDQFEHNETFTTGTKEQMDWRAEQLNPILGYDIRDVFQEINSTFDYDETNQKTVDMVVGLLKKRYDDGYYTAVYIDNDLSKCEEFKQASEKVLAEHEGFDYRIYRLAHSGIGLREKGRYLEAGTLFDILNSEKD